MMMAEAGAAEQFPHVNPYDNLWGPKPAVPYPDSFLPKYRPDWPGVFSAEFALEFPEDFRDFPDLGETLRELARGRGALWLKRQEMSPGANLSYKILRQLDDLSRAREEELLVLKHQPALKAREHLAAVQQYAQQLRFTEPLTVLKTVTLKFPMDGGQKIVLFSGVGDYEISKGMKRTIGEQLRLPNWSAKNVTINPDTFDPRLLGYIPGQVKPFIKPHVVDRIDAICYLHKAPEDKSRYIAVTASLFDSAAGLVKDVEAVLDGHFATLPLTTIPSEFPGLDIHLVENAA